MLRICQKQAITKERLRNFIAKTTLEDEPRKTSSFQQNTIKYNMKAEDKNEIQLLCNKEKLNTYDGLQQTRLGKLYIEITVKNLEKSYNANHPMIGQLAIYSRGSTPNVEKGKIFTQICEPTRDFY